MSPDRPVVDLDRLPQGLEGYYEKFWSDIEQAKAEGWADWNSLYRPVMERLAVAAETVTADWIGAQIGRDPQEVRERALWRWRRLLAEELIGKAETWRVIHRSSADFLEKQVNLRAAHRAVAEHYTDMLGDRRTDWDNYGLRHVPMHLAAAAADPNTRHALIDKLLGLVLDPTSMNNSTCSGSALPTRLNGRLSSRCAMPPVTTLFPRCDRPSWLCGS